MINPLNLLDKKSVEIKYENNDSYVAKTLKLNNNSYIIYISNYYLNKFDFIKKDILLKGLKLHEISHIKYNSFKNDMEDRDNLFKHIYNILEDNRIEYNLSLEYPITSKYFNLVLKLLENEITVELKKSSTDTIKENNESNIFEKDINYKLDNLYSFVRFNKVLKNGDEKFIDFLRPLILSSKRGNYLNGFDITEIIYRYILFDVYNKDKVFKVTQNKTIRESNFDDIVEDKELNEKIREIQRCEDEIKQIENEKEVQDDKKAFQNLIVEKDQDTIKSLIRVFKNLTTCHKFMPSLEGEINYKKIQEAYINSFIGEEGENYLSYKFKETQLDCIIFRDISGSTDYFKKEYAEATINLVAALNYFKNSNIGVIDFDNKPYILKNFNNKNNFNVMPYAGGSTNLTGALKIAEKYFKWKNKSKYIIIICDGYPDNLKTTNQELKNNKFYEKVNIISICLMSNQKLFKDSIIVNKLKDMPEAILKKVVYEK